MIEKPGDSLEARSAAQPTISRRKLLGRVASIGAFGWGTVARHALGAPRAAKVWQVASRTEGPEISSTGKELPALASFDDMMVDFLREQHAIGAALAVSRAGKLVYARGFGVGNRQPLEVVQPESLFRIASVTKPITSAAVMQLIDRKRLTMQAKVHELLELPKPKDKRWQQVTVGQLLHHTGGWDRDKSFDPMFRSVQIAKKVDVPPPAMPKDISRYMVQQPLDFDPGTRYAYSNFGYSLLGRVIEKVTGARYGEYVQNQVLRPLGIRRMRLGATLFDHRAPEEVRYFDLKNRTGPAVMGKVGKEVPLPYGTWCLEAMDSHGGWIASAVDLVRFASAFDMPQQSQILQPASIETTFARPNGPAGMDDQGKPKVPYYGCGWSVRPAGNGGHNTWHNGALDGTSTLLVRRFDGLDWAVLFNCRQGEEGKELSGLIDPLVHKAADAVSKWPAIDQFAQYL